MGELAGVGARKGSSTAQDTRLVQWPTFPRTILYQPTGKGPSSAFPSLKLLPRGHLPAVRNQWREKYQLLARRLCSHHHRFARQKDIAGMRWQRLGDGAIKGACSNP